MDQPNPATPGPDNGSLVPAISKENGVARTHTDAELAAVRQMMESLYSRFETLQQNNAIQFAGVHERLDAVELEIPLIQEQSALRMRDIESRVNAGIEEVRAELQAEVSGRLGTLSTLFETQHRELSRLQEAKQATEYRLNRAIHDLERLTNSMARTPQPQAAPPQPATPAPAAANPAQPNPRFEEWKKQYMDFTEADEPEPPDPPLSGPDVLTCPRCYSIRIRPAAPSALDRLFRIARLKPHRCRSCSHRFYKMGGVVLAEAPADCGTHHSAMPEEALETQ